jgi:hypothetical protein
MAYSFTCLISGRSIPQGEAFRPPFYRSKRKKKQYPAGSRLRVAIENDGEMIYNSGGNRS